jgi:hypothetical protein
MPSSCSNKDLEYAVKAFLGKFSENSDIIIDVKVDEEMCQLKSDVDLAGLDANTKRVM